MVDLAKLDRPPAGFAGCVRCAYRDTGSAPICFACASEHTEPVPLDSCEVCDLPRRPGEECQNPLCSWDDRYFTRVRVDDVFTEGFTHREVARALIESGASEVSEIALARQPFRG